MVLDLEQQELIQEYQLLVMEEEQKLTVVVNNDSKIETVTVSSGGSGYTFGTLDIESWWSSS